MITSSQNQKIREVRALVSKRREREAAGLYITEGIRLVEEALAHAEDCAYLLWSGLLSARAEALVKGFADAGVPAEEIDPRLMDSIAGTDSPQGVLAVMRMRPRQLPEKAGFVILADGIQDPGNLGTLFRTAAAAGADAVLLMPGCADEFSPKVIRSGMGTHFRLPIVKTDWDSAERWLRAQPGMQVLAADSDGGTSCWKTDLTGPTAIIIGSEGNGPCDRALALSDGRILIPMPGAVESLNAGIAAGILIFEAVRQRSFKDEKVKL